MAPFSLNTSSTIQVQYGNQSALPLHEQVAGVNAGIFSINGQGAIINQDGTVNKPANPAKLGSIVSVYCTGMGTLKTPVIDGSVAPIPPPYNITELANAMLSFSGQYGTTLWIGAAPGLIEGVTQINVQLPATLPAGTNLSAVRVFLSGGGSVSPTVLISLMQ